jgi:hypothetical protein
MREDQFFVFLTTRYKGKTSAKHLAPKPARDVVSRCRRVEHALGIDLDTYLSRRQVNSLLKLIVGSSDKFQISGNQSHSLSVLIAAARKYAFFHSGERPPIKKPYAWVKRNL